MPTLRSICDGYVAILCRIRFIVLFVWVALGGGLAMFVLKFVAATTQEFSPPDGTPAATAEAQMALAFPDVHDATNFNVVLHAAPGHSVLGHPQVVNFSYTMGAALAAAFNTTLIRYVNYFALMATSPPANIIAANLINGRNTSMVFPVMIRVAFASEEAETYGARLQDVLAAHIEVLDSASTGVTAYANGLPIMIASVTSNVQKDMGLMDGIVIPIAVLIMAMTVRSLRLMILPVACIGLTLVVSFASMYFVTFAMAVSVTTPSLMMSLSIAMSIDYSLFIAARYVEELRGGMSGPFVVSTVIRTAGATIVVSGVSLMVSLMGLIFFPIDMLRTFGVGCSLCVFVAMVVALTFSPSLLLAFPKFFEAAASRPQLPLCIPLFIRKFFGDDRETLEEESERYFPAGFTSASDKSPAAASSHNGGGGDDLLRADSPAGEKQRLLSASDGVSTMATTASGHSASRLNSSPPGALTAGKRLSEFSTLSSQGSTSSPHHRGFASVVDAHASIYANVDQYVARQRSLFYRLRVLMRWPWNLVVFLLIAGFSAGIASQTERFKTTDDFLAYISRGSEEERNYKTFTEDFGFSFTEPYYFLFRNVDPNSNLTLRDRDVFDYCAGYLQRITNDTLLPARTNVSVFSGLFAMGGAWNTFANLTACFDLSAACDINLAEYLIATTSDELRSFYTIAKVPIAPTGNLGDPYYRRLLAIADSYRNEHLAGNRSNSLPKVAAAFEIYISGIGPDAMDAIDVVYKLFPIIVGVSGGAVMLIVGAAFRSVLIPLCSVVTIAMTEGVVFGFAVLVYQTPGILNWMGWPAVASQGAVSWTAPIVAFSVVLGVALDYGVFLVVRIRELLVDEGMSNDEAVLHGLCATGGIITAAGLIMSVAFFGLLMSSTGVLNLLGFFMVAAVLFDTFIVRPLVVPTMMTMLGRWNWWPLRIAK